MPPAIVTVSATIAAPAATVYAILADYHTHHPQILPSAHFTSVKVEEGGMGAGTVFSATMNVMGNKSAFRMRVDEPEPGRVLRETDLATGLITTFTVEPKGPAQAEVTIRTTWQPKPGLAGQLEQFMTSFFMRRIYREELKQLDAYAEKVHVTPALVQRR